MTTKHLRKLQRENRKLQDYLWGKYSEYNKLLKAEKADIQILSDSIKREKDRGREVFQQFSLKVRDLEAKLNDINSAAQFDILRVNPHRRRATFLTRQRFAELEAEDERLAKENERVFKLCREPPQFFTPSFNPPPVPEEVTQPSYQFIPITLPSPRKYTRYTSASYKKHKHDNHDESLSNINNLFGSPSGSPRDNVPNIDIDSHSDDMNFLFIDKNVKTRDNMLTPKSNIEKSDDDSVNKDGTNQKTATDSPVTKQGSAHIQSATLFSQGFDEDEDEEDDDDLGNDFGFDLTSNNEITNNKDIKQISEIVDCAHEIGSSTFHKLVGSDHNNQEFSNSSKTKSIADPNLTNITNVSPDYIQQKTLSTDNGDLFNIDQMNNSLDFRVDFDDDNNAFNASPVKESVKTEEANDKLTDNLESLPLKESQKSTNVVSIMEIDSNPFKYHSDDGNGLDDIQICFDDIDQPDSKPVKSEEHQNPPSSNTKQETKSDDKVEGDIFEMDFDDKSFGGGFSDDTWGDV